MLFRTQRRKQMWRGTVTGQTSQIVVACATKILQSCCFVNNNGTKGRPPLAVPVFLFHGNQFTVKLKLVIADGLVASELLSVNAFTVTV